MKSVVQFGQRVAKKDATVYKDVKVLAIIGVLSETKDFQKCVAITCGELEAGSGVYGDPRIEFRKFNRHYDFEGGCWVGGGSKPPVGVNSVRYYANEGHMSAEEMAELIAPRGEGKLKTTFGEMALKELVKWQAEADAQKEPAVDANDPAVVGTLSALSGLKPEELQTLIELAKGVEARKGGKR
jgi:hypothetical protein